MSSGRLTEQAAVITDASCIIILEKLSALHLLHLLFESVYTTPEIAAEYGSNLPAWLIVVQVNDKTLQKKLSLQVDAGEASAIALAFEIENKLLITDDLKARNLSIKLGLSVIGTLGVLLRAKENNCIQFVRPFVEKMRLTDFRVSDQLYNTVLAKAGEL